MVKSQSSTPDNPVWVLEQESHWTIFWCWVTALMKDWHWRFFLGNRSCKLVTAHCFCSKVQLQCILTEKSNLGEYYRFLVVMRVWFQGCDCKESCIWGRIWALILWADALGSMTRKTKTGGDTRWTNWYAEVTSLVILNV